MFKIIEFDIAGQGSMFLVSQEDNVELNMAKYETNPMCLGSKIYDDEFTDIASAWHRIGKLMSEQERHCAFIPNTASIRLER